MDRVALLIDAENVSSAVVPDIFGKASGFGRLVIRRAFASYASENVRGWRTSCYAGLGITPVHVPTVTKGKNAADISLAIDAMEIALTGKANVICIVSSDGDFSMLGHKLRESGVKVIGFGDSRSPAGWQGACDTFLFSEERDVAMAEVADPDKNAKDAMRSLESVIRQLVGEKGEASLCSIGNALRDLEIGFTPKRFGFKKLSDLARNLKSCELLDGLCDGDYILKVRVLGTAAGLNPAEDAAAPEWSDEEEPSAPASFAA